MGSDYQIYSTYVDEIIRDFVEEIERNYDIQCVGTGWSMPNNVEQTENLRRLSQHGCSARGGQQVRTNPKCRIGRDSREGI